MTTTDTRTGILTLMHITDIMNSMKSISLRNSSHMVRTKVLKLFAAVTLPIKSTGQPKAAIITKTVPISKKSI